MTNLKILLEPDLNVVKKKHDRKLGMNIDFMKDLYRKYLNDEGKFKKYRERPNQQREAEGK